MEGVFFIVTIKEMREHLEREANKLRAIADRDYALAEKADERKDGDGTGFYVGALNAEAMEKRFRFAAAHLPDENSVPNLILRLGDLYEWCFLSK